MSAASPLCAGLAVVALIACGAPQEPPLWTRPGLETSVRPEMGPPQPGDAAPAFTLPALDGAPVRLQDLRGSWLLVHFTASWCPFCDAEVEHLGKIADAYADRRVRVVLVDVQESEDHWHEYARAKVSPRIVALWDADGSVAARYAPPGAQPSFDERAQVLLDATLIVDPAGTIRLFVLANSKEFDPTFSAVLRELDRMLQTSGVS